MDSSVDEEEVITSSSTTAPTTAAASSSDSRRIERDGPSENSIITSLKSLDRVNSNTPISISGSSSLVAVSPLTGGGVTSSSSSSSSSSAISTSFVPITSSSSSGGSSSSPTAISSVQVTGSLGSNANSLPVRTANGIVFTSCPSPTTTTSVKHNNTNNSNPVSQTIAVPQPGGSVSIVQLQLPNQTNVVQSVIQPVNQQSVIQATGGAVSSVTVAAPSPSVQTVSIPKNILFLNKQQQGGQGSVIQSTETNEMNSIQPLHLISSSRGDHHHHHGETIIPSHHHQQQQQQQHHHHQQQQHQQPTSQTPSPNLDEEAKARREGLTRRPSYRKIFNDLSTTNVGSSSSIADIKSEDDGESSESSNAASIAVTSPYLKVVPTSTIQLASAAQDGTIQGLQTLTMTNATSGGNTIVQYATQGQDGQFFVPVTVSTADLQAYQLRTGGPTGLPQGVVMTTPNLTSPHGQDSDEVNRKRELRLLKNREAAKECRRKKKEYIKCLEQRVTVLETQNKALIEELKSLKELYCQKE